ncbi:MAG TPA: hypothetical protein H9912_06990 [Candidatus Eisenbergiella stercorigallinarum]|uniref:beta-mannosidase n=1 Tax=Candidatus Eisenbergiella stercorigallinarum TaxID=2838557 RepID=A0A9D2R134_9FIRM|nr:hypothetical protein [Candidatus Eisenbergiella stercorigallinarum]
MSRISLDGKDWKIKEFIGLDWVWRDSVKPDTGDTRWWEPATVPGTVLHDMWKAGKVPDPYFELNSRYCEWVPERTWVYRKEFEVPEGFKGKRIRLCFDGIDYAAEIFLNGESLGRHEGMFIPWKADVGERLLYGKKNLLAVVLEPAPREQPQVGRTSLVRTNKSRMTYWWDFCPRMIHQGIWQSVYLDVTEDACFEDVYLYADVQTQEGYALVHLEVRTEGRDGLIRGSFGNLDFEGRVADGACRIRVRVDNPRLWWTNGAGEPYEYPVRLELYGQNGLSDSRSFCYGLRDIRFVTNEGLPEEGEERGKLTLCLNGKRLYIKGYNWVPADVMYGCVREDRLEHLVGLARRAGVNMFRVWGGGLIETDAFYRICARNGILIWQEFIQSSSGIENKTPEDEDFCRLMERQAGQIIRQKRNHTALAVWCGGNELQDAEGMPLDGNDKMLRLLHGQVRSLDRKRKWLPTSPSGGYFMNSMENIEKHPDELFDVHGPWEHQGLKDHCRLYNSGTSLMASEFGVEGMTGHDTLRRCVKEEHLLPASKDNEIYFHRGAWWDNEPLVQETFAGKLDTVEKIRRASQFLQYEGLKYAVECNLRRAMRNSASFPWQFNEPYPNLFCTSAVDYYGQPKPVYYGMKKAYASETVTARFDSPALFGKESFQAEIYASGSRMTEQTKIVAELWDMEGKKAASLAWEVKREPEEAEACAFPVPVRIGGISAKAEEIGTQVFLLRLGMLQEGRVLAENEYLFTKGGDFGSVFEERQAEVTITREDGGVRISNAGGRTALFVFLTQEDGRLYPDTDYVSLLPKESRIIQTEGKGALAAEGLNVPYRRAEESRK